MRTVALKLSNRAYIELFVLFFLAIFAAVFFYLHDVYEVDGKSMEPTLHSGERVVVDKKAYINTVPRQGDIISFQDPENPNLIDVKRIVAEEGDEVFSESEGIFVNGIRLKGTYTEKRRFKKIIVPRGSIYVLGDNRRNSFDSRDFGPLSFDQVKGKVKYVIWPFGRFRRVR